MIKFCQIFRKLLGGLPVHLLLLAMFFSASGRATTLPDNSFALSDSNDDILLLEFGQPSKPSTGTTLMQAGIVKQSS